MALEEYDELVCSLTTPPTLGAALQPAPGQHFNPPTWFGAIDPEFLIEVSETIKLSETDWSTFTFNTSYAKALKYPATEYSVVNSASEIDRYGVGYHDAEPIDFKLYNYMFLAEAFIDFKYTVNEKTMAKDHQLISAISSVIYFGKNIKVSNTGTITHPTGTTSINYSSNLREVYAQRFIIYRRSTNKISTSSTMSGLYPEWSGNTLPTPIGSYDTPNYIGLYRPFWYGSNGTQSLEENARALVDAENTKLTYRLRMYRVPKPCIAENMMERIAYMYENKALPPQER